MSKRQVEQLKFIQEIIGFSEWAIKDGAKEKDLDAVSCEPVIKSLRKIERKLEGALAKRDDKVDATIEIKGWKVK